MVRVAGLLDQVVARVNVISPDGRTPQAALAELHTRVLELTAAQSRLWREELVPALAGEGILIGTVDDASDDELRELEGVFARQIYPVLTPLAVGPGQPFPYISGLSLSLGVTVRHPDTGEERFARVKVPEVLPRFVSIGSRGLAIPLETVISHYLELALPRYGPAGAGRLPGDTGRRHRDLGRRGRPARGGRERASAPPLRRRRPARGVELDLPLDGRPPGRAARDQIRRRLPDPRPARPRRCRAALRPRPPGPQVRAVDPAHPAPPLDSPGRRPVHGDRRERHRRRAPVRLVRDECRGVRHAPRRTIRPWRR